MIHARPRFLLPTALTIAILAVSTASILIRFAQREAGSLAIAALRLVFASFILGPLALSRHRAQIAAIPRSSLFLAALSGLFLAVHFATWITSLAYTSVASSVVLVSTGPIWVALLSPIFLGERLSRTALIGLGLAIAGGLIIAGSDICAWSGRLICEGLGEAMRGRAMFGNLLALMGAWAVSGYLMVGRRLRQSIDLIPYIFLVYALAGIALLAAVYLNGGSALGLSPGTYLWIVLLAIIPQLIGHSTYNWALRDLPAALVAVATLGEPIGSAILAYLILGEIPGLEVLFGGFLVLGGIYLAARTVAAESSGAEGQAVPKLTDADSLL